MNKYIYKTVVLFSILILCSSCTKENDKHERIESVVLYYSEYGQLQWEYGGVGVARSPGTIPPEDGTPLNLKIQILHPPKVHYDTPVPKMNEKYLTSTISGLVDGPRAKDLAKGPMATGSPAVFSLNIVTKIKLQVVFLHIVDHSLPTEEENKIVFSFEPGKHKLNLNGIITGWYKDI